MRSWLAILERLDAVFRVPPYGPPRIKSVKKEQKLYFWDPARAESEGARFENVVALHLLRLVHWARDGVAVEAKLTEQPLEPGMRYLLERVRVPFAFQVHAKGGRERRVADVGGSRVRHVSAARFLASLP